jgi:uncharacterized protein
MMAIEGHVPHNGLLTLGVAIIQYKHRLTGLGKAPVRTLSSKTAVAVGLVLTGAVSLGPHAHGQPSFDCRTNTGPDESTICASPQLSQLDRQLSNVYLTVRDRLDARQQIVLRDAQRAWLRQRAACGMNTNCIAAAYRARIPQLQAIMGDAPAAPTASPPRVPAPSGPSDACDRFPTLC